MDSTEVRSAIEKAAARLVDFDATILERDVNERTLTHRLAVYLEQDAAFTGWYVDCEYNRDGTGSKRLPNPETIMSNDTKGRTIYPDIIVHKRIPFGDCETDEQKGAVNLIVIEAKKDATPDERKMDRQKLQELKERFRYRFAVFVNFHVDRNAIPRFEMELA